MNDEGQRAAAGLSRVEFGSRTSAPREAQLEGWLQGESDALARLHQRAIAVAQSKCCAVVVSGEPGSQKRELASWLLRQRNGWAGPRVELSSADLERLSPGEPQAAALLVTAAEQLRSRGTEILKDSIAQRRFEGGVVMTTSIPLAELRAASLGHEQLFGRLTDAVLDIPPLRTRPEDIPALAHALVGDAAMRYGRTLRGISTQALAYLSSLPLPGNTGQLHALIERAVASGRGDWITERELGGTSHGDEPSRADRGEMTIRLPGVSLREIEIRALTLALKLADGRIVRAAELLGITRHALRRKLEKFGLESLRANGPASSTDDAYI